LLIEIPPDWQVVKPGIILNNAGYEKQESRFEAISLPMQAIHPEQTQCDN